MTAVRHILPRLPFSGLFADAKGFERRRDSLGRILEILAHRAAPGTTGPVVISMQGGTGCGKSTLFNALVERTWSLTGIRRPLTEGPLCFVHERWAAWAEQGGLGSEYPQEVIRCRDGQGAVQGKSGTLTLLKHRSPDWESCVLVDAPDLDSVERKNRWIAEEIFITSDLIVFIASEEKYADASSFDLLRRAAEDEKPYIVILNKGENRESLDDLGSRVSDLAKPPVRPPFHVPWTKTPELVKDLEPIGEVRSLLFSSDPVAP